MMFGSRSYLCAVLDAADGVRFLVMASPQLLKQLGLLLRLALQALQFLLHLLQLPFAGLALL
jgi:hypothetical protein